jgi:periplasmic copper chaperone A
MEATMLRGSLFALALAGLAACTPAPTPVETKPAPVEAPAPAGVEVLDAYIAPATGGRPATAAYLVFVNTGEADRLVGASSSVAKAVEIHDHVTTADGMMSMVRLEDGLDLPKDSRVALEPGGKHLMFIGLTGDIVEGQNVTVTLQFEKAGARDLRLPAQLVKLPG